jgi:diguanylate cyclase (GGDEF)-like protein
MDLYGLSTGVEALRRRLETGLPATERVAGELELAWYLRERDTAASLRLAEEAEALTVSIPPDERARHLARIDVLRANGAWLAARLDEAAALSAKAIAGFDTIGDAEGAGDARLIAAAIALDRGDKGARSALFEAAHADYRRSGDPVRIAFTGIALVRDAAYSDRAEMAARWAALEPDLATRSEPAIIAARAAHLGAEAYLEGGFDRAILHYQPGFEAALSGGLVRTAIVLGANIASSFDNLNDHATALEWAERALDLARAAGWPALIAIPLGEMADSLRGLGRYGTAVSVLAETIEILRQLDRSEAFIHATMSLAELSLAMNEPERALGHFREVEMLGIQAGRGDFQGTSLRGQAAALNALGRVDEALAAAEAALGLAGVSAVGFDARRVLAQVLERKGEPPEVILVPLLEALEEAAKIEGFAPPGDFLSEIARHHAAAGDFRRAYEFETAATEARGLLQTREASARAVAVQVRLQTERAKREAAEHAARARTLEQANESLLLLGQIGQEITANLSEPAIIEALVNRVADLVDATTVTIYLLNESKTRLILRFGREAGSPLPDHEINLDDPHSRAARCARSRAVLIQHQGEGEGQQPALIPGTLPTMSMMFAPLLADERLLGVFSVQSTSHRAYGDREQAIFQTLCAYGAIALANAQAMARLRRAEEEVRRNMEALQKLALHDSLTGIGNRRNFVERAGVEIARARRHHSSLGLVMFDLDHFKRVNDRWGHAAGDEVLRRVAEAVRGEIRPEDFFARIGGEEFVVLMEGSEPDAVAQAAERLREAIARTVITHEGVTIPVTASFGVTRLLETDAGMDPMLARADKALYQAKNAGRNRVCIDADEA